MAILRPARNNRGVFKHLLFPLGVEDVPPDLVAAIRDLALHNAARVTLLHVIETIEESDDPELSAFYERLEGRAEKRLRPVTAELFEAGVESELVVRLGRRWEEIVRFAAGHEVDLIAMRSRTLAQSEGRAWPSISIQVAMVSPVPVLLLR